VAHAPLRAGSRLSRNLGANHRNVLSDLSGVNGMAIVQAILAGQRDARKLAALADP